MRSRNVALIAVAVAAVAFAASSTAFAAGPSCEAQAAEKKLAGARSSAEGMVMTWPARKNSPRSGLARSIQG